MKTKGLLWFIRSCEQSSKQKTIDALNLTVSAPPRSSSVRFHVSAALSRLILETNDSKKITWTLVEIYWKCWTKIVLPHRDWVHGTVSRLGGLDFDFLVNRNKRLIYRKTMKINICEVLKDISQSWYSYKNTTLQLLQPQRLRDTPYAGRAWHRCLPITLH